MHNYNAAVMPRHRRCFDRYPSCLLAYHRSQLFSRESTRTMPMPSRSELPVSIDDTKKDNSAELAARIMSPGGGSGTCARVLGQQGGFVKKSSTQAVPRKEPTDTVNPIIEAEARLAHLAANHEKLPQHRLRRELMRAEDLLMHAKATLKGWASDPEAPGALPGTAAVRNTLDGIDWALLAVEEGGVANVDEALQIAAAAAKRSKKFMEELFNWRTSKPAANMSEGSLTPKRAGCEVPTSSCLTDERLSNMVMPGSR